MSLFNRYKKKKFIDEGAFGRVYKVYKDENQAAALKVIDTDGMSSSFMNSLIQEVFITSTLEHSNIVKTSDVFFESNKLCIEMEWIGHGNLYQKIKKKDISLISIVMVLYQMTKVLMLLKEKRMIHRDIKPSNILVEMECNDRLFVKLGDFGLTRRVQFLNDYPFKLEGTMNYLSQEVLMRIFSEQEYPSPYTFASDMFALGVTIFQLLTCDCSISIPHFMKQSSREKFYKYIEIQIANNHPTASPQFIELVISMLTFHSNERITCDEILKIFLQANFQFSTNQDENSQILNLLSNGNSSKFMKEERENENEENDEDTNEESSEESEIDPDLLEYIDSLDLNAPELVELNGETISNNSIDLEKCINKPIDMTYNYKDEEIILLNGDGNLLIINRNDPTNRKVIHLKITNVNMISFTLFESEYSLILLSKNGQLALIDKYANPIWSSNLNTHNTYRSITVDSFNEKIFLLTTDTIHVHSLRHGHELHHVRHPIFMNFNVFTYDHIENQFFIERDGNLEIFTPGLQYISHFLETYDKIIKIDIETEANRVISLETSLINIALSNNPSDSSFIYEKFDNFCLDRKNRNILAVNNEKDDISILKY